jgi:hypothetical protein
MAFGIAFYQSNLSTGTPIHSWQPIHTLQGQMIKANEERLSEKSQLTSYQLTDAKNFLSNIY